MREGMEKVIRGHEEFIKKYQEYLLVSLSNRQRTSINVLELENGNGGKVKAKKTIVLERVRYLQDLVYEESLVTNLFFLMLSRRFLPEHPLSFPRSGKIFTFFFYRK